MIWDLLWPAVSWWGSTSFALWLGQSTMRVAWLLTFHLFGLTVLLVLAPLVMLLRFSFFWSRAVKNGFLLAWVLWLAC